MIAQWRDGFQRHVAGTLDRPLTVQLEQDPSDEADDGTLIRKDADDFGLPLDLAVEAFDWIAGAHLGSMLRRERLVGEHVGLGLVEEAGKLWQLGAELIGDPCAIAQLRPRHRPGQTRWR